MLDIRQGDALALLREMPAGSVDAVVTDPPYGLSFMGKAWDTFTPGDSPMRRTPEMDAVNAGASRQGGRQRAGLDYQKRQARDMRSFQEWSAAWAVEALRVAKPWAHLLAFGGTRTYHRLTCAVEDAGWEIRDCLSWIYGSGFPKSLDVSKAIDKAAGEIRPRIPGGQGGTNTVLGVRKPGEAISGEAISCEAIKWSGWGTALKPAWEPVILARKPLVGTVAANVQEHGTGAINVDGCRIDTAERLSFGSREIGDGEKFGTMSKDRQTPGKQNDLGRWPANVLLDEDAAAMLDEQSGESISRPSGYDWQASGNDNPSRVAHNIKSGIHFSDSGGASRFFYTAKSSSGERHYAGRNGHPTVKPVDLMRWLCRLVTPPGGLVLDPFCGSGSTGVAALAEGFRFIGMEQDAEWCAVARRRIAGPLFSGLTK